jgi:hypothetical protein
MPISGLCQGASPPSELIPKGFRVKILSGRFKNYPGLGNFFLDRE